MIGTKLSLAVGGQSLAAMFLKSGRNAFDLRLRRRMPRFSGARLWGFATSGSVAASTNRPIDPAARANKPFWWDMEEDQPSAEFSAGLAACAPFLLHPCEALLWDQGQSDALAADGTHGRDPEQAIADFTYATGRILETWRKVLAPKDPGRVPIILFPHAPHPAERHDGSSGVVRIRAAQQAITRSIPNCHDAGVVLGMTLKDNLHPTTEGLITYALHAAEAVARVLGQADGDYSHSAPAIDERIGAAL